MAAARVLRDNCEAHGHSESCYKLGAYQAIGKGERGAVLVTRLPALRGPRSAPMAAVTAGPSCLGPVTRAPAAGGLGGVAGSSPAAQRAPAHPATVGTGVGRAPGAPGGTAAAFPRVPNTGISS